MTSKQQIQVTLKVLADYSLFDEVGSLAPK